MPWDALMLAIVVDLLVWVGGSVVLGITVARRLGCAPWKGVLVGLVPYAGPVIWAGVATVREPRLAARRAPDAQAVTRWSAVALLGVAGVLFTVASFLPWGEIEGTSQGYSLGGDTSMADTAVGALLALVTVGMLASAATLVLALGSRVRAALLAGLVGLWWTPIALDAVIAIGSVGESGTMVSGVTGGRAGVDVGVQTGLWLSLAAGFCTLAALLALAIQPSRTTSAGQGTTEPQTSHVGAAAAVPTPPAIESDGWWNGGAAPTGPRAESPETWWSEEPDRDATGGC